MIKLGSLCCDSSGRADGARTEVPGVSPLQENPAASFRGLIESPDDSRTEIISIKVVLENLDYTKLYGAPLLSPPSAA